MDCKWIRVGLVATAALCLVGYDTAFGRGGRGGGGFGGGGGGGGARPNFGGAGGGNISRPSGGGVSRPSGNIGSAPSFNRPSGVSARPSLPSTQPGLAGGNRPGMGGGNLSPGNRPSIQPGTRPNLGDGNLNRPSTLPGSRPDIGNRPGIGNPPGIGNRPEIGNLPGNNNLPGVANRPGAGQRPATLPGLGSGDVGSRLPNQGSNLANRFDNRPQSVEDRRTDLTDRMTGGRQDWQNHRENMQDNRFDWKDNNREDWRNWADNNHRYHGDWYHDCWHGGWYPGASWNHMWDHYPVAAAFGLTTWGINRMAYGFGYWGYSNPYATTTNVAYDYSQPIVVYADSGAGASGAPTSDTGATPSAGPQPTDAGTAAFDAARNAFYQGDYPQALSQIDVTLKTMPHDSVVHEFRGLVLFALKRYPESAAAVYAVLSAGPGWDWTTLSSLYADANVYTKQLRDLEAFTKSHPESSDAHFLLGYHYLTMGHAESASAQFQQAQAKLPNDKLLQQLTGMTTPPSDDKTPPAPPAPVDLPADKVLTIEKLVGTWSAASGGATFDLQIAADGRFTWTYTRGKDKQSLKGVAAVDQNDLALEPDTGGTMLAEVDLMSPAQFLFKMISSDANDAGLQFKKK